MDSLKELLNKIFKNPGIKIKKFSKVYLCLIIISSTLSGLVYMIAEEFDGECILIGLGIILGGIISSFLLSFPLYAFGELVDKTSKIEKHLYDSKKNLFLSTADSSANETSELRKYKQLLDDGVISAEAYESIKADLIKKTISKGE